MIKANELRIGNLVEVAHETNSPTVEVKSITEKFINVFDNRSGYDLDFVLPILLTEEWLLKFGFVREHDYSNYWSCEEWNELYFLDELYFEYESKRIAKCKYVHQLQNLYFALTGEELTIT